MKKKNLFVEKIEWCIGCGRGKISDLHKGMACVRERPGKSISSFSCVSRFQIDMGPGIAIGPCEFRPDALAPTSNTIVNYGPSTRPD